MNNKQQCSFFDYKHLNVIHQNIAGLLNKCNDLTVCLEEISEKNTEVDIICLSEHFMLAGQEQLLYIPNYTLAACYSRKDIKWGGARILAKKGHQFKELQDIAKLSISGILECCAIDLTMHNTIKSKRPRVEYQSPITDLYFFEQLEKLLCTIYSKNLKRDVIIAGNYNIDCLKRNNTWIELECLLLS